MELKDKRIIVSGCAKGMGEATLNSYVKAGAHVIGMDIDSELGQTVAENANIIERLEMPKSTKLSRGFEKVCR